MSATQSPQEIVLAPLKVRDLSLEATGSFCRAMDVPVEQHCASFELSVGSYIGGRGLALADSDYLYVIPNVGFRIGTAEVLADSRDAVFYMDYLKGQPEPAAKQQGREGARTTRRDDLLKANPWMTRALAKREEDEEEEKEEEAPIEMSEDVVAQVMARPVAKRKEFEDIHDDKLHAFDFYLRREYAHRGTGVEAADAARGEALSSAVPFCRTHSLAMSSTYSFRTCGGEQVAHRLAQEWCRRMQHVFDASMASASPVNWPMVLATYPIDEAFEKWANESEHDMVHQRAAQISSIMPL